MRISVFGLGYVGVVTAGCLAQAGHRVVGTDIDSKKVQLIADGNTPVVENKIDDIISAAVRSGRLTSVTDGEKAVVESDLCLVCVGTPSRDNGSLDLSYVERVCSEIGRTLAKLDRFYTVVVRSTVLPGTSRDVLVPALESAAGKRLGAGFGYCYNPEFLREGTAVDDFFAPAKTVISASDDVSRRRLGSLYETIAAPVFDTDIGVAEMVKYADNAWHALKVGFANEIGALCKALHMDSHEVMRIFCRDSKLNIAPTYLRPGFAFGGSCLPKDLRALLYRGRQLDLELPILASILPSNELQIGRAYHMIRASRRRHVGVFGLSFKAGTDDLRESPMVRLVERLLGTGYALRIYDGNLKVARLRGTNLVYLLEHIPHISSLLCDSAAEVAAFGEVVVVGNTDAAHRDILARLPASTIVLDLARAINASDIQNEYHGICW